MRRLLNRFFILLVRFYQKGISPLLPDSCRYYPTCSNYMLDALKKHGPFFGLIMGVSRIIRCNPFIRGGVDPVPDNFTIFRNPHPEDYEDPIIANKFHPKR